MRLWLKKGAFGLLAALMLAVTSCMNDDGTSWTGKWQLREYEYADGSLQQVDSIFYGFQKGTFLALCMNTSGQYETYYGYYGTDEDEITITLWPDSTQESGHRSLVTSSSYKKFFDWGDGGERTFQVEELSNKKMRLVHDSVTYVFRKY